MGDVIQFRRELDCIVCQARYTDTPGPRIVLGGKERRANICPECRGEDQEKISADHV